MTLTDLLPILQLAIGPTILVSGVGLVMLSMTNRFSRIIDRSRQLTRESRTEPDAVRDLILAELRILARRARVVRAAIALASSSVLLAALLIMSLFAGVLFSLSIAWLVVAVFSLCLACLIAGLILFIYDINLSLRALWLEMPVGGDVDGGAARAPK
ncbi:MAG: DUF2721 domain-containing protein [Candidatus Krumholzibacteria bacterium]|nr:DUF2721 domain-containing protein [Candidatus Krumholzibacteria bacterium]